MSTIRSPRLRGKQDPALTPAHRTLVERKFEMLRDASFGFAHDRLLHLQADDLAAWTDACTAELRRKITSVAPSHVEISLIEFRTLRCISLQCLPLSGSADGAGRPDDRPGSERRRSMPLPKGNAVAALALLFLASLAAPPRADGQIPTGGDFATCNAEALDVVKAGTASPTQGDHVRADRARAIVRTTTSIDFTSTAIQSSDPQIHGMEAQGARDPRYQAAYRGCMRRKVF
jgi:hypothetical protein